MKPDVKNRVDGYDIAWKTEGIIISVTRLRQHSTNGRVTGEILIKNDQDDAVYPQTTLNFNAAQSRARLAKTLQELDSEHKWLAIMNQLCLLVIDLVRQGEPVEEIWPSEDDNLRASYLLYPLLYLNHPTIIFGDYGSLKSLMALVIGYVVQLPYRDNTMGLTTTKESAVCLYLDYEDDKTSFRRRWSALERGFGEGGIPILYRRMTSTVYDSVEQLLPIIHDKKISLIITDSLGPAARGNLNDSEPAIKYHAALRQLGVTSLTLAHTSKDQFTKKKSVFGSVFFTNLARSVWECKAEQEIEEDEAVISLKHTKANLSRLHPPLGYHFSFTENMISIDHIDLKDTGLSGELPLSTRIKDLLRRGSITVKEIATILDANEASVRTITNRLYKRNQLVNIDGKWGLKQEV